MPAVLQRLASRFDSLRQDFRYAVRGLIQQPGFALGVIITIGLGIGANAVMFSLVDRLLFRPPAMMRDPESVHRVYYHRSFFGKDMTMSAASYPQYSDFRNQTSTLSEVAGFSPREMAVGVGDLAHELRIAPVSASFFGFFDAPPIVGRYFTSAEDSVPSSTSVAVLSYPMWMAEFGGRRDIVGTTVQMGAVAYTIIGVTPRGFVGLWPDEPPAAFIPLTSYAANDQFALMPSAQARWNTSYGWLWMEFMVRRKPDVTIAAVNSDLTRALMIGMQAQVAENPRLAPQISNAFAASILPERGPNASETAKVAIWVIGVAIIVLMIATANVANLFLARALRRRREIAVRLALGVTRARLLSQLLIESTLLAALGGIAGLLMAHWSSSTLRSVWLPKTESLSAWRDARALLVVGAAALVVGALTGLASAWQASRTDLTSDLKSGARDGAGRRSRSRASLLVIQAALSVVLLIGAGLFVRSLEQVQQVRLGYDVDPILWADLNMRGVKIDSAEAANLRRRLLEVARGMPEVADASLRLVAPMWGRLILNLSVPGIDSVGKLGLFYFNAVSPEYFSTMGTRIVRGRSLNATDRPPIRSAVVSEGMAQRLWPNEDAVGKCIHIRADTTPCVMVVGVAENIKATALDQDPGLYYYIPSELYNPAMGGLLIRTRGDGNATRLQASVRRELQRVMPGNSYVTVRPFAEIVGEQTKSWRVGAMMFVVFGLLALVVAAVGLYSVVGYDVTQRSHELGVRMALGARAADITRLVVSQGLRFVLVGAGVGGALALVAGKWVQPLLFKESARDPAVFALVIVVLLLVALAATIVPARKAAGVDPNLTLKAE